MHGVLATNSDLVFVWHDNSGQSFPEASTLLRTKVSQDGFTIDIQDDAVITEPLIILTSSAASNTAKNVVNIGKRAKVQIVEYIMADDNDANNNIAMTINCGAESNLQHCILHQAKESANIVQQSITSINQDKDSNVTSNIFSFGAATSRIELAIALQGQNATCEAAYLAYTHESETQNVLLKIDHLVPHCTSKSLARSILKDKSITDFVGRIVVHPDAMKSFADLQIKNIICSPKAQANNRPELEIYNDDVHCSHGSSTGQMNEEALFYMRSRGLDAAQAIEMIIEGFIQPAIDSCKIAAIPAFIKSLVMER
ncbi:MAG TPA: SufD family Fe-S cluster assembly protein [Gammaproteobacteria bacterium]|nr:SufD family Fe-S cluster assembly protein [Gammaproteobacteria bacterium]